MYLKSGDNPVRQGIVGIFKTDMGNNSFEHKNNVLWIKTKTCCAWASLHSYDKGV